MATAILFVAPFGVAGDITRRDQATVETQVLNPALPFVGYGLFGKMVANAFVPIAAADVAGSIYGLLVRPFPTQGANASDPIGTGVPKTSGLANVLRRGYASVQNLAGTPAQGGQVYVRIDTPAGAKIVDGVEALADSTHNIAVPGCTFTGPADASGNCEISFNI
jgi:hypothetical protein